MMKRVDVVGQGQRWTQGEGRIGTSRTLSTPTLVPRIPMESLSMCQLIYTAIKVFRTTPALIPRSLR